MPTRERIVDAAAQVMRSHGLARATTRQIAKTAGYSEATLYKHFRDKTDLFVAVLSERIPSALPALLAALPQRTGRGDIAATLEEVAAAAISFYTDTFPIAASVFSEPALLQAHRTALGERGTGPANITAALTGYLAAERELGRLAPGTDPRALADLLLGACLQHAFLSHFPGERDRAQEPHQRAAAELVAALLSGTAPQPAR